MTPLELTLEHRAGQQALSRRTAGQVLALWGEADPANIDAGWPLLSRALAEVIDRGFSLSAELASIYVRKHAAANRATVRPAVAGRLDLERLAISLRVTGPIAVKIAAARGMTIADAGRVAAVQIVGSGTRLAMLGGRNTINNTIERSDRILGYRRIGVGKSCKFCEMLIGRGAVYKSAATAGGLVTRSYHDHDDCQSEPLYAAD